MIKDESDHETVDSSVVTSSESSKFLAMIQRVIFSAAFLLIV